MAQHYLNPKDEQDPRRLPNVEVWEHPTFEGDDPNDCPGAAHGPHEHGPDCDGWYWQSCFPGCLPDGEPFGPFETEAEALEDARQGMDDEDESEDSNA